MNTLLSHITKVKEDQLGVKEFQVAVLSALLDIMKEQESLNKTLQSLSDRSRGGDNHLGNLGLVTEDDSSADEMTTRIGNHIHHIHPLFGKCLTVSNIICLAHLTQPKLQKDYLISNIIFKHEQFYKKF